jgi:hypothetical protein
VLHRPGEQELLQLLPCPARPSSASPGTGSPRADGRCGSAPAPHTRAAHRPGSPAAPTAAPPRPPAPTAPRRAQTPATPSVLPCPRNRRTNASSAPVRVKCRISSARLISGKPRSCSSSSSENTSRVATGSPPQLGRC